MAEPGAARPAPFRRPTLDDFAHAYAGGRTPTEIAEACLAAVRASDAMHPPLRAVITSTDDDALAAAEASTARWRAGQPLSPLDGVPVVVKDNLDMAGVPTTNGTTLEFPVPGDSRVVTRLRAAGAVVVGKANLHEIGAGVTGINPHHGTARNPHDPQRWCGGSSSGSACAVGAGLVPLAIGTDAGGSIRAPAAFCGAVGFKPTFGRVSRLGLSIVCDTIDHIGPIATTCADAARALVAIAAVERDDEETWDQPPLPAYDAAVAALERQPDRLRIGIDRALLEHHTVDADVAARIEECAEALADAGAELVDVGLPDPDHARLVGLVILGAEGPSGHEGRLERHHSELGADVRVLLEIGAYFSARDYLKAQRLRRRIRDAWHAVLSEVDYVLSPSAGIPAGPIHDDALRTGEVDQVTNERAISQTFPSNLTGYPAVSVPYGDIGGLPVGAQIIGRPWDDLGVLGVGRVIETLAPAPARPARWYGLL